jgi:serine/threonine protein phosphatase 1
MRILAIGDIHGCLLALNALLELVKPQSEDQVILLGDYVDRGPDSFGVIDRLITLQTTHRLITLRGNHDQMMLDARHGDDAEVNWLHHGGDQTLASYSVLGDAGKLVDVPDHHWQFLEETRILPYETATHFFVHANVVPHLPLDGQTELILLWEKLIDPEPHVSGKIMICGHTAQKRGGPLNLGHAVCIDTFVYGDGWLTCLDVTAGQVWQANQRRQTRAFHIDDLI